MQPRLQISEMKQINPREERGAVITTLQVESKDMEKGIFPLMNSRLQMWELELRGQISSILTGVVFQRLFALIRQALSHRGRDPKGGDVRGRTPVRV